MSWFGPSRMERNTAALIANTASQIALREEVKQLSAILVKFDERMEKMTHLLDQAVSTIEQLPTIAQGVEAVVTLAVNAIDGLVQQLKELPNIDPALQRIIDGGSETATRMNAIRTALSDAVQSVPAPAPETPTGGLGPTTPDGPVNN